MIIQTPKIEGDSFAHCYVFHRRGDHLPVHQHPPELEHRVRVIRGRVKVYGPWGERTVCAGETFQYPLGAEHGVWALEDDTVTEHDYLLGMPDAYRKLSVEELSGVIE